MTKKGIAIVEEELGVELPPAYRRWLLTLPPEFDETAAQRAWEKIGHVFLQPNQITQATTQFIGTDFLAETEWEELDLSEYLAIGGDGLGNYYVIERDEDDPAVHFLCHDPPEFEENFFPSVADYCAAVDAVIR